MLLKTSSTVSKTTISQITSLDLRKTSLQRCHRGLLICNTAQFNKACVTQVTSSIPGIDKIKKSIIYNTNFSISPSESIAKHINIFKSSLLFLFLNLQNTNA